MNEKLRAMMVGVGVVVLGGTGFYLLTPQPATRTMAELRDAGIADGQSLILVCPEKLTPQTRRRINSAQPGFLRPRQLYARVARVAKCFTADGGNCFRPADWSVRVADLEGEIIVPSLRHNLDGVDLDASVADDGGDPGGVDDSNQYELTSCRADRCATYDAGAAPGIPWPDTPCAVLNRLWAETPPCVLPACWVLPDGGWDSKAGRAGHPAAPDCRATGARGTADGGPRWWGCNVLPSEVAVGTQCLPVECSVLAGDDPPVVLGGL
jgi:hypothetical protein